MQKKTILAAILMFLAVSSVCLADFGSPQWKYFKNISAVGGSLAKITLDDEIFSGSKNDLRDVRIIDKSNKEIPFKIVSGKQREAMASYPATMLNNSFVSGQFSTVILDLKQRGKITNNLTINTSSENFQRNVTVFGSDDMANWNTLKAKAYIYDYTDKKGNFKSQNTTVSFPDSAFQYIKLEIADDNNSPVVINSVMLKQNVLEKRREFERRPQFSASENSQTKTTEITVDLGSGGIPTSRLVLKAQGDNFNRGVIISASNDKLKWNFLNQGYVFRYTTPRFSGENMEVNFTETNSRYLKIEIINKDNEALAVSDITIFSVYKEVIFQPIIGDEYRLFYGNAKAGYPEYDLEKYFQYLDVDAAQAVALSIQKENSDYVPEKEPMKPLSERMPYLFPTALTLAVLCLLFLVYKFLKK